MGKSGAISAMDEKPAPSSPTVGAEQGLSAFGDFRIFIEICAYASPRPAQCRSVGH